MIPASVGYQCPECVREGRRTQRSALTHFGGSQLGARGYVTNALIALNVVMFLAGLLFGGFGALGGVRTPLHDWGAVLGQSVTDVANGGYLVGAFPEFGTVYLGIDDGAYYRLLTSMFLHYGIIHLALNMYVLWMLGRPLEAALGRSRFLALYLVAGLGGGVAVDIFSSLSFTAGASGAIFGLFAAYFLVLRKLGRDAAAVLPIIIINVVFTFLFSQYISVAGHLGGLVVGAVCGLGLAYAPRQNRTLVQAVVLGGTALILIAITVWLGIVR